MRKSPCRHKVGPHKRKGTQVYSYSRGKGTGNVFFTKRKILPKTSSINWNIEANEKNIAMQCKELREKTSIKWMSPAMFLVETPALGFPNYPATLMKEKDYDAGSLRNLKKRIESGQVMDILYLDYSRMHRKFPAHEGRHRAFLAKQMGIKKVPVLVVRDK